MRSLVQAVVVVVAFLGVAMPWHTSPAFAAATKASGSVTVTKPTGSDRISRGGSATPFTLRLPDNSTCPGDSADDDYRVQSFLVPKGTDLETLTYKSQGPDVAGGWALYKTTTSAFIQEQTADAEKKGDPGAILPLPALSFAVFVGDELAPGSYHIGVACSLLKDTVKYWATEIDIRADPDDEPAGLRWVLPGAGTADSGTPFMALIALAVVIGAGGFFVVAARRGATTRGVPA